MIKEITVFSPGDSNSLTCWSNVPYLFIRSLENRGIKVNKVNIYSNKYIRKTIWKYLFYPIVKIFYKKHAYTYEQTFINRFLIERKIRKSITFYKNSDLNVFISYDYLPNNTNIPNVLFCDWTFEYLLKYRLNIQPCAWEIKEIERQRRNIENASIVISLFPDITEYMRKQYNNKNIYYLNQNVINNVYNKDLVRDQIVEKKFESNILLFIGRENYLEGAKRLIESFKDLKRVYTNLELHIIGLKETDFDFLPNGVYCYGYLNKSIENDRICYYSLLSKAKLFVNPTFLWGGYSSCVEAMYFYTPLIVNNYKSFVDTFGDKISFGFYYLEEEMNKLTELIDSILMKDKKEYFFMCDEAHRVVKGFTWDSYIDKFLDLVDGYIKR